MNTLCMIAAIETLSRQKTAENQQKISDTLNNKIPITEDLLFSVSLMTF